MRENTRLATAKHSNSSQQTWHFFLKNNNTTTNNKTAIGRQKYKVLKHLKTTCDDYAD